MSHQVSGGKSLREYLDPMRSYLSALLKWLILAVLVGVCGGVVGALFHIGVEEVTMLRGHHPWLLYLLPAAGLLITALYRFTGVYGVGTNAVLEAVHEGKKIPFPLLPAIFFYFGKSASWTHYTKNIIINIL